MKGGRNVGRGLFRLWLVGTVLWAIFAGVNIWQAAQWDWEGAGFFLLPPIIVLIIGVSLVWTFRRGLFRLWVVAAVLWAVGAGSAAWYLYPKPELDWVPPEVPPWEQGEHRDPWERASGSKPEDIAQNQREAIVAAALVGLLPPIVVLVVGAAFVWAFRGFNPDVPAAK
jgi:hypothetical protein